MRESLKQLVSLVQQHYQTTEFIPLHEPRFDQHEKDHVIDCIDSTFVSSVGKYVDLFEQKLAAYTGAKHAIATVNGTSALHIALHLAGVGCVKRQLRNGLRWSTATNPHCTAKLFDCGSIINMFLESLWKGYKINVSSS